MQTDPNTPPDLTALTQRLEDLERENARLRRRLEPVLGPDNPAFDVREFQKAMAKYVLGGLVPLQLIAAVIIVVGQTWAHRIPRLDVLPGFPLFDPGGYCIGNPAISIGVVAIGALAIGVFAFGGGALGIIALGGGSIGIIALGGGSLGVVAVGGGAVGYVAIGGGAFGHYVLAGGGAGKYCLTRTRQDKEAIDYFTRLFPALRRACTGPLPVVVVSDEKR